MYYTLLHVDTFAPTYLSYYEIFVPNSHCKCSKNLTKAEQHMDFSMNIVARRRTRFSPFLDPKVGGGRSPSPSLLRRWQWSLHKRHFISRKCDWSSVEFRFSFLLNRSYCSLVIQLMAASSVKALFHRHFSEISKSLAARHATCFMLANEMYSRELIAEVSDYKFLCDQL